MKALIFSDIHGDVRALERLMATEADYYFAAGDLATWAKGLDRCGEALRAKGSRVYVLPGNHESAGQIASFCEKYGLHNFHEQTFDTGRYQLAGLGYSSPTPFHTPGEYTEEQMAERLARFDAIERLVLVCHAPPFGTDLDRIRKGLHAGSRSVREFIEKRQPEFFFCGHIHEAEGVEVELGRTRAVNVGKRGFLLEC